MDSQYQAEELDHRPGPAPIERDFERAGELRRAIKRAINDARVARRRAEPHRWHLTG